MLVEAELTQHSDRKARVVVVNIGVPLLPGGRVDETVVVKFKILHMQTNEEPVVEEALVDVWTMLKGTHLSLCRHGGAQEQEGDDMTMKCSHIH